VSSHTYAPVPQPAAACSRRRTDQHGVAGSQKTLAVAPDLKRRSEGAPVCPGPDGTNRRVRRSAFNVVDLWPRRGVWMRMVRRRVNGGVRWRTSPGETSSRRPSSALALSGLCRWFRA
jgi:hypothetical protein